MDRLLSFLGRDLFDMFSAIEAGDRRKQRNQFMAKQAGQTRRQWWLK